MMDHFMQAQLFFEQLDKKQEEYSIALVHRYIRFCLHCAFPQPNDLRLEPSLQVIERCIDKLKERLPAQYAEIL